ncbi:MSP7-like protein, putative, partial [Hepatocystis sp. ex Piliocolobus tephrosceles]
DDILKIIEESNFMVNEKSQNSHVLNGVAPQTVINILKNYKDTISIPTKRNLNKALEHITIPLTSENKEHLKMVLKSLHMSDVEKNKQRHTHKLKFTIRYLDNLFDDILKEADQQAEINNTKYHRNYNNLKRDYEFPLNELEYNVVKTILVDCLKKGDDNSKQTYLPDVLKLIFEDQEGRREFDNLIYGIYSYAKKYYYISGHDFNISIIYKYLFSNILNMIKN